MVKEKYIVKSREINLSVTNGEISSVIKKNITTSACRVYDNGRIGVAGKLGEADDALMEQAEENLKLGISYEAEATSGSVRREQMECGDLCVEDNRGFLKEAEEVLHILREEYPQIIFGNKVYLMEESRQLINDAGTNLYYSDRICGYVLLIKHVDSVNVFDDSLIYAVRDYHREAFLKEAREHLDAFLHMVPLPEGDTLPVIINTMEFGSFLVQNLDAMAFGHNTSFFNGKLGEKLFDDKFSLYVDRSKDILCNAFFDVEGSTCEDDKCYLIQNGVLVRPFADKKLAKEFGYENTATAAGAYDSVPTNTANCFAGACTGHTLEELIGEGDGIYISVMSGGDFTSEGNFASPVQTAFLYRGGKLAGRLPEFNISGNIYDMFGKDFVGITVDKPYEGEYKMVVKMKVNKN